MSVFRRTASEGKGSKGALRSTFLTVLFGLLPLAVAVAGPLFILDSAPVHTIRPMSSTLVDTQPQFSGKRAYTRLTELISTHSNRSTQTPAMHSAAEWARGRFQALGMDATVEEYRHPFPSQDLDTGMLSKPLAKYADRRPGWNVVAKLPGRVNKWILVGAHLDITPDSIEGAVDNGTGVATAMELADALRHREHHYGFLFVLFDGEEPPLAGSLGFPAAHPELPLRHVLIIDSVGAVGGETLNPYAVSRNGAAPTSALRLMAAAATAEHLGFAVLPSNSGFGGPRPLKTILDRSVGFPGTDTGSFYGQAATVLGISSWGTAEEALNKAEDMIRLVDPVLLGRAGRASERYLLALDGDQIGSGGDTAYVFARGSDGRIGFLSGSWVNAALAVFAAACLLAFGAAIIQARSGLENLLPSFRHEAPFVALITAFPFVLSVGLTMIRALPFIAYVGLCALWLPVAFVLVTLLRRSRATALDPDGRLYERQKLVGASLALVTALAWLVAIGPYAAILAASPGMLITLPIGYRTRLGRVASRIATLAVGIYALVAGIVLSALAYFDSGFYALALCLGLALVTATQGVYGFSFPRRKPVGLDRSLGSVS